MRQINDLQYAQFTPKERVQLVFAALARNDEAEATRLWETCPRYKFITTDLNFTEQVSALNLMSALFFEKIVRHYNCIKMADQFISGMEEDLAFEEEGNLTDIVNQTKKNMELAERTRAGHLIHLKAAFQGFERFCAEIGMSYEDVLKTIPIETSCWNIDYLLKTEGEVDEQLSREFCEMLLSVWKF
jgi:hypothetical protein